MRRLRVQPGAVNSPQSSSWQLYPWGPTNQAFNERYDCQPVHCGCCDHYCTSAFHCVRGGLLPGLKETLPLALPIYASLINFRATAELLGRCSVRCVKSLLYNRTCLSAQYSFVLSAILGGCENCGKRCGRYVGGGRMIMCHRGYTGMPMPMDEGC